MTYCVAAMIDAGIVMASDSRTNAGVDNIATFRKMKIFENPGERVVVAICSGNLAITQATINRIEQTMHRHDGSTSVMNASSMYDVAELFGTMLRDVRKREAPFMHNVDSSANFIIGGQIHGERPRLFLVYPEGNFIEATTETPYFQIGEVKYGKPIIDRVIMPGTMLSDAVKCILVSFDSTMRSNLSVGMPIDLVCYEAGSLRVTKNCCFNEEDAYMQTLKREWNEGVRRAFAQLPALDWDRQQTEQGKQ